MEEKNNKSVREKTISTLKDVSLGILFLGALYVSGDNYLKSQRIGSLQTALDSCYQTNYDSTKVSSMYNLLEDTIEEKPESKLEAKTFEKPKSRLREEKDGSYNPKKTPTSKKPKEKYQTPKKTSKTIEEKFSLKPMKRTYVNASPSQESYDSTITLYEKGGWVWIRGTKPTKLNVFDGDTYLSVENNFHQTNKREIEKLNSDCIKENDVKVISVKELYKENDFK